MLATEVIISVDADAGLDVVPFASTAPVAAHRRRWLVIERIVRFAELSNVAAEERDLSAMVEGASLLILRHVVPTE